jgi:hypothetical protein
VSRATKGVTIPGRKATRAELIHVFKDHLRRLKARLDVHLNFFLCDLFSVFLGSNRHWRS